VVSAGIAEPSLDQVYIGRHFQSACTSIYFAHFFFLFECQHFGKGLRISRLLPLVTPAVAGCTRASRCMLLTLWSRCI
jgi:hypothetical protein